MPMMIPFGRTCCGGGNSFWGAFLGATLGSYLGGGNIPYYNNNNYHSYNNFSYGFGGVQSPLFNYPSFNMPSLDFSSFSAPQMSFPTLPQLDLSSNSSYMSSPFSSVSDIFDSTASYSSSVSSNSGVEAYNPFSYKPEVSGTSSSSSSTFDSNDYFSGKGAKSSKSSSVAVHSTFNTNTNLPQLKSIGYNAKKGKKLAQEAASHVTGFNGACGTKVREALERAGLANGKRTGSAADFGDVLLKQKNFKEVSANGMDLKSLPAGCILVYGRGVSNYNPKDGHVEITLGDGRAASDGLTNNIRPGARIFVPV